MSTSFSMIVRSLVVLGFVLGLPAMAIPGGPSRLMCWRAWGFSPPQPLQIEYVAADRWRLPAEQVQPVVRSQSPSQIAPGDDAPHDGTGGDLDWRDWRRLRSIQAQLQQWGADYVLLESLGDGEAEFRCYCLLDSPKNPAETHSFEAVERTAVLAAQRVLEQAAVWRDGKQRR